MKTPGEFEKAQPRKWGATATFFCFKCRDLGVVYVLNRSEASGRWFGGVRPCLDCKRGQTLHAGPGDDGIDRCVWSSHRQGSCPCCGARAGGAIPMGWDGQAMKTGRVLSQLELLHLNDGTADDPVVLYCGGSLAEDEGWF